MLPCQLYCVSTFVGAAALQFNPTDVFFGMSVTVTCGPPPASLSFGSDWTAEWRLDGNLISNGGKYSFSTQAGASKLTVSSIFTPGKKGMEFGAHAQDPTAFIRPYKRA